MAAATSVGAAIDYLVTMAKGLDETANAVVSDGFTAQDGSAFVLVGVDEDTPDSTGAVEWAGVGGKPLDEAYEIPVAIHCATGDPVAKTARDAAIAIFDAFLTALLEDVSLGGALHSGSAMVADVRLRQTNTPADAGEGRVAAIYFNVRCTNRMT
jgi:hypothetical protein